MAEDIANAAGLERLLGYQLRRASAVAMADIAEVLSRYGLRPTLYGILSTIEQHPSCSQSDIGRRLAIQRANMVPLLAELEQAGWIDRAPDPNDRRGRLLTIAPGKAAALAEVHEEIWRHDQLIVRSVGKDIERVRRALARIWQMEGQGLEG